MFERAALIHYHEIGLKGRNRAAFERRLQANLQSAVHGLIDGKVGRISSRLVVPARDREVLAEVLRRVSRIPGVSHAGAAYVTSRVPEEIRQAALLAVNDTGEFLSFAVDSRRSSTDYPVPSMETNRDVGAYIQAKTGARVDLGDPEVTCWIEVVQGQAYVFAERVEGPGGLPVGTSGNVIALLSAGIDSPVAAWRVMKRGAVIVAVHFSGRPQTSDHSERLAHEICRVLERSGGLARLYVVSFGDLQREISLKAPPDLRVLLYRRLMIRVAEEVARLEGAHALVTGESLGQVASQTLENIAAVDAAAILPVLRPLIGLDKLEIIEQARALGTYELSIQPHADCCTLFMPRTPATRASVAAVEAGEVDLDLARMVADALSSAESHDFACAAYRPPRSGGRHTNARAR